MICVIINTVMFIGYYSVGHIPDNRTTWKFINLLIIFYSLSRCTGSGVLTTYTVNILYYAISQCTYALTLASAVAFGVCHDKCRTGLRHVRHLAR